MVYGRFAEVAGVEKHAALEALMEHLAPGRQPLVRAGNEKEYAATTVLRISLDEAACKTRSGPPKDDAQDMDVAAWAGELPMFVSRAQPVADAACSASPPDYVRTWAGR